MFKGFGQFVEPTGKYLGWMVDKGLELGQIIIIGDDGSKTLIDMRNGEHVTATKYTESE